jgi:hypothetical protein
METVEMHSDDMSALDDVDENSRIYLVRLYDPGSELVHSAATSLSPDDLLEVDAKAGLMSMTFVEAIMHAAASRVAVRVRKIAVDPDNLEIHYVSEISRRELAIMVAKRDELRAEAGSS